MKTCIAMMASMGGIIAAASVMGCTRLPVTKVSSSPDVSKIAGIRYSLPRTFLSLVPQMDGTVTADSTFLPDEASTYAVNAFSIASTHSLAVKVDGGLLKEVDWQPDPTALPAGAIGAASELTKSKLDALTAERKAKQDKIDAAQKGVDDAVVELATAQKELGRTKDALKGLPDNADAATVKAANEAVATAQDKVNAAQDKLDVAAEVLKREKGQADALPKATAPGAPKATVGAGTPLNPGAPPVAPLTAVPKPPETPPGIPIFFQVIDDESGVYLKEIRAK
jgi:hypothetical protein